MTSGVVGVLLTGGSSRRLGVDKATLRVGDETLAQRGARLLSSVVASAVEVGPGRSGLPSVWEVPRHSGPLRALIAAADTADAADASSFLLLATDLPAMSVEVLEMLAQHPTSGSVVPRVNGRSQLVCARWSAGAVVRGRTLVAEGSMSLRSLEAAVPVVHLDEPQWGRVASADAFSDVDEPADLERLGDALKP